MNLRGEGTLYKNPVRLLRCQKAGGSVGKESTCNAGDLGLIPGLVRSPGEGHGNPLQYSCLGNPMDRGSWWATVHGGGKVSNMTKQQLLHDRHRFGGPRSLVGYSPWGCEESDTTEQLTLNTLHIREGLLTNLQEKTLPFYQWDAPWAF